MAKRSSKPAETLENVSDWLPSKLKRWRDAHGLSQESAAPHLRVTLGTYRNWEQGRKPPGTQLTLDALLARLKEPVSNGNRPTAKRTSVASARG